MSGSSSGSGSRRELSGSSSGSGSRRELSGSSSELGGRPVLVAGVGASGSAAARALHRCGAAVLVVDTRQSAEVEQRAEALVREGIAARTGEVGTHALAGQELVVTSPGIAESDPLLVAALDRGVPVWSEPELAWRLAAGRTRFVGVTGTNGKTTTTELVAACLGVPSAGNIGTPLSELLGAEDPPPLIVAELSSFQLRFCHMMAPNVALLLNVSPDHLDWHGSERAYADAKARIWRRQSSDDWAVVNVDDPGARELAARRPPPGRFAGFTIAQPDEGQVGVVGDVVVSRIGGAAVEVVAVADLPVAVPHHVANTCAAIAAAICAGADPGTLAEPLRRARPGPHRLELVATLAGVRYVNDSKATNPHAAAAALSSFERIVWIAGGLNKGLSFDALRPAVAARVRAVVTIGDSGPEVAALARALGLPVVEAGTLTTAVGAAADLAEAGDTVLLAPACASMDQFTDYAERGRVFRESVKALAA